MHLLINIFYHRSSPQSQIFACIKQLYIAYLKPSELSLIYVPIILKILLSEDFSVNSFVILSFVYNQAEIENRSHFLGWESAFKYQLDVL